MSKLELNQASTLRRILTDKVYAEHMVNFDMSTLENCLDNMSEKQYKYILHLIAVKKWITVKTILNQCGLKDKLTN